MSRTGITGSFPDIFSGKHSCCSIAALTSDWIGTHGICREPGFKKKVKIISGGIQEDKLKVMSFMFQFAASIPLKFSCYFAVPAVFKRYKKESIVACRVIYSL